jgi:phosphate starvation-inducible PhoH-like protein
MSASKKLEFETAHFLHGLFADDLENLKLLGERLAVTATTRDGWLKFEGGSQAVASACAVMAQLEESQRSGTPVTKELFLFALESVRSDAPEKKAAVQAVHEARLTISAGKPPVVPKTQGQLEYLQAMDKRDVIFGVGPAGTGKTYLAMAKALFLLKQGLVERVILTRPAVEAGEALGFLPGDLKEKIFPYLRPLYDALYDMLKPDEVERLIEKGAIEIAPLAYMRGRTLSKACVILDEAQNTTCEQMFMCLTRIGMESKCIVTGDATQVDLKPNIRSGLQEAIENLQEVDSIAFHFFEERDVIRHSVVRQIIEAYRKKRGDSCAT